MPNQLVIDTWERLMRYHRTTTTAMDQRLQGKFGHSLDDYDVLHQLNLHGEPIRMGDLAERLLVANSSCNRVVSRLVDAGLVNRSQNTTDGRVVLVALTSAGNRLRRRMAAMHTRDIESHFGSRLTATNTAELGAILQRLQARSAKDAS